MMSPRRATLADLRRRIDRIDATIQALLIRRTAVVEKVRDLKKNERVKIRPGREAEIIYRLIRRHKGPFPKLELVRIWRELIVATLRFEGPFSVAVFAPHGHEGIWDLARDQYGSFTPISRHDGARAVIRAVTAHRAAVGVLPLPAADEDKPWWPDLVPTPRNNRARAWIIARLPFAGGGNARGPGIGAFAIAPVMPDPSGRDHACLGLATDGGTGRNAVERAFKRARLGRPDLIGVEDSQVPGVFLWFADIPGYVREDDPRLAALKAALGDSLKRATVLGAYAEPLGSADLAPGGARRSNKRPGTKDAAWSLGFGAHAPGAKRR
ncbi:MAG: chorismate mutase [Rhodospirillales bacterium]|nr:chorismate mutase [Rhodospirillales bacterium]